MKEIRGSVTGEVSTALWCLIGYAEDAFQRIRTLTGNESCSVTIRYDESNGGDTVHTTSVFGTENESRKELLRTLSQTSVTHAIDLYRQNACSRRPRVVRGGICAGGWTIGTAGFATECDCEAFSLSLLVKSGTMSRDEARTRGEQSGCMRQFEDMLQMLAPVAYVGLKKAA